MRASWRAARAMRSLSGNLAGTEGADLRNSDGSGWMVLADPEGNESSASAQQGQTREGVDMIIEVDRDDLHRTRQVETASAPLAHGDPRLGISGFALTANNVTYGAFGDTMQYWNFFPAAAGWGRYRCGASPTSPSHGATRSRLAAASTATSRWQTSSS